MIDKIRDGLANVGCAMGIVTITIATILKLLGDVHISRIFITATLVGIGIMMVAFIIRGIQLARGKY